MSTEGIAPPWLQTTVTPGPGRGSSQLSTRSMPAWGSSPKPSSPSSGTLPSGTPRAADSGVTVSTQRTGGAASTSVGANAVSTEGLDRSSLVVSIVRVDEGPTMKRWRPRAKGAANRILKRSSHITVVVQPADVVGGAAAAKNSKKKGGNR